MKYNRPFVKPLTNANLSVIIVLKNASPADMVGVS